MFIAANHAMLDFIFFVLVITYVRLAPYTKVEESFNVQAVHDVIFHKKDFGQYDHAEFPGVVPRTFVGPILLAKVTNFVAKGAEFAVNSNEMMKELFKNERIFGEFKHIVDSSNASETFVRTKMHYQVIMRVVLGFMSSYSVHTFHRSLKRNYGDAVATYASLLALAQFHLAFYASRPLPNIFAFVFTTYALSLWVDERSKWRGGIMDTTALAIVSAVCAVFRCDNVLLLAPLGIHVCLFRITDFYDASLKIITNVMTSVSALCAFAYVSIQIDSHYWQKEFLWPEFEVLSFNNPMGANKSEHYGTKPFPWYFYSALPRMLLIAYPLSVYGFMQERRCRPAFMIAFFFVFTYSFLGHKELRFLFPVLPLFNFCAACGFHRLSLNRKKSKDLAVLHLFAICGFFLCFFISIGLFANASIANYPGGLALKTFHELNPEHNTLGHVRIHLDDHCAQSGASRFGQAYHDHNVILYNKRNDHEDVWHLGSMLHEDKSRGHDWIINETPELPGYDLVKNITAYAGLKLNKKFPFFPPLIVKKEERTRIWKRKHGSDWQAAETDDGFSHEEELLWVMNGARKHDPLHPYMKNKMRKTTDYSDDDDENL